MAVSDQYLWDRSGGDEEVERLEKTLGRFALRADGAPALRRPRRLRLLLSMAAVAASAAAIAVIVFLPRGAEVLTEERTFDLGRFGSVRAEAKSRVAVVRKDDQLIKLRLEEGTVHASITLAARPRLFQVETPATTCVDLGCKYTLTVDAEGRSQVQVTSGRVAFVDGAREVYVPSGAGCEALKGRGSSTPAFLDIPERAKAALRAFDLSAAAMRGAAARAFSERAERLRETLPLFHLIQDPDPAVSEAGLDGLARLAGFPEGVTRGMCLLRDLKGMCTVRDPKMIEAWREYLEDQLGAWW
jgi:hypothetical protein